MTKPCKPDAKGHYFSTSIEFRQLSLYGDTIFSVCRNFICVSILSNNSFVENVIILLLFYVHERNHHNADYIIWPFGTIEPI